MNGGTFHFNQSINFLEWRFFNCNTFSIDPQSLSFILSHEVVF